MADAARDEHGRGTMPPYVPFPSFKNLIQNAKQQGLATRIDRSVLTNFSGSTQTQLITALRFLGLTDTKGHPTDRMVALVEANGTDEWPKALSGVLRNIYPTLFEVDLARASPNQFNEQFRKAFPGAESVQRKAVTFFIGAAQDAGVPINPLITKNKKPRSASPATGRRRTAKPRGSVSPATVSDPGATMTRLNGTLDGSIPRAPNAYELLAVFDPNDMAPEEQAAVWTLIQYLKRKEVAAAASRQRRERSARTRPVADTETKEAEDEATLAD